MPEKKSCQAPRNQRLRLDLYASSNCVYFITIHARLDQRPFIREDLNRLVLDVLREEEDRQKCDVYTYCLMPDHLHFLVSPRLDGISVLTFTDRYKGKTTNRSWGLGWRGRLWQPRSYDHIVRTDENLVTIADYIRSNPVRKGLVEYIDDWPWSGQFNDLRTWK
jgi:putative transposase